MADTGTDLIPLETTTAALVFAPGGVEAILEKIAREVKAIPMDISTVAGRAQVASVAYKIARSKTALDEMGKSLVADWKAKAAAVDAERRTIRDRLDALKDEVRKPLTDWEQADQKRIAAHEEALASVIATATLTAPEPTAAEIEARIVALGELPPRDWQEFSKRAEDVCALALKTLNAYKDTAIKRETERAELERLRREQAEREQRERDEKIAREAAEKARLEAEAKAKREADAAAERAATEQRRVEQEKADAEERARQAEAARVAAVEKAEADKRAAATKAEQDRVAAAAKAKRDQEAAVEAERKRTADAKAAEDAATAKREADKKHRGKINSEAKDALIAAGISEQAAVTAITAIAKGEVPHVKVTY